MGQASRQHRPPTPAYLDELRLTRFKSFHDAVIPLSELTVFIGRNASGKSNALDGLVVLSRLAADEDIREAIDGVRADGDPVRGGALGCAPFGTDEFTVGCRVRSGDEVFDFDLTVRVGRNTRIVRERLRCVAGVRYANRELHDRELLETDPPQSDRTDIVGRHFNGKRGVDPGVYFSTTRPLLTQVGSRVPFDTEAGRLVHRAAATVRAALREVFVLDPIPHHMRQYVNRNDAELRRNADNLSATVYALQREAPEDFAHLERTLQQMPERPFAQMHITETELGDVLLSLEEPQAGSQQPARIPAHQMSDGMLRFLAIGTALLSAPPRNAHVPELSDEIILGQRTLVIEEIENGLHPPMAAKVIDLVKHESASRRIRTVVTTHSPPLLDALAGDDHTGVIVFDRGEGGGSRVRRLVDLPGYPALMAAGGLGEGVSGGGLSAAGADRRTRTQELSQLLVGA